MILWFIVLGWVIYTSKIFLTPQHYSALSGPRHVARIFCCCSSLSTFSPVFLHLLPLSKHQHFQSIMSEWRCVPLPPFCFKLHLIFFRNVPAHDPKPLTAAADWPPHIQIHAGSVPGTFLIYNICHPQCCAQTKSISRKLISCGSSLFLVLTHARPLHEAKCWRCGELRGIIHPCISARILQYICNNFISQIPYRSLDVAALPFYWHAETTDDLCMKRDKHFLLLCELQHWYSSVPFRTH